MKKSLIFISILIVAFIAFFDAELDEVAANTPSQVEMKQQIRPPVQQNMNSSTTQPQINNDAQKLNQQIHQNPNRLNEKFDKIKERRNTVTTPVN